MQRTPNNRRKLKLSGNNAVKRQHNRDVSSTPILSQRLESPSFGDISPCHDMWEPSPIPFMATQEGSHCENDVIWSYYSPKSKKDLQNLNTPIRRKRIKRQINEFSPITRLSTRRKLKQPALKNVEYLQGLKEELLAINKDIQETISTKKNVDNILNDDNTEKGSPQLMTRRNSDMFEESLINGSILNNNTTIEKSPVILKHPLKNNICDKIKKCENEGIESDDSMNECLLMASQMVEEVIKKDNLKINQLPVLLKRDSAAKIESPKFNNDSFDNLILNINECDIEALSQVAASKNIKSNTSRRSINVSSHMSNNVLKSSTKKYHKNIISIKNIKDSEDLNIFISGSQTSAKENNDENSMNDFSNITNLLNCSALNESKSRFSRHNSMPESPREPKYKKLKSNSPGGFIRHKTMPTSHQQMSSSENEGSSPPMQCTQDEIMKKRQAAKEKLLARRNGLQFARVDMPPSNINNLFNKELPHSSTVTNILSLETPVKTNNSLKCPESTESNFKNNSETNIQKNDNQTGIVNSFKYKEPKGHVFLKEINIHEEIERKRQEALLKLQSKRTYSTSKLKF